MGGKGGAKGSNDAVVNEQRIQAEEARLKEAARQGRLQEGMKSIKNAFEGSPIMGSRKVQKTRQVANPARATWSPGADSQAYNANAAASAPAYGSNDILRSNGYQFNPGQGWGSYENHGGHDSMTSIWTPAPNQQFSSTYDASGRGSDSMTSAYTPADFISPAAQQNPYPELIDETYAEDETYDTGEKSGGFGDKFYNDYGQSVVDYYQPQVDKQYEDAKKETTYRLARSGNLRSQASADETARLSKDYDLNKANVLNKADIAKGDLRDTVAAQRGKLETALYATEDPTTATNNAIASVRDISLQEPELSPLGAIFNVATIGGANFLKGAQNAKYAAAFPDGTLPTNKSRIV